MKTKIRKWIITVLCILIVYGMYVTVDCIRIKASDMGTKPFVTTSENIIENRIQYSGLGYTISYYVGSDSNYPDTRTWIKETGYGAEFRLFHRILIWAWVE